MRNLRKAERFEDFGRVENPEICVVSGILEDISENGIKASYSVPPSVDLDKEYQVAVRLSRVVDEPLTLIVKPARVFDDDSGNVSVGFSILHSKDSSRLEEYLSKLKEDSANSNSQISAQDNNSLFI